MDSCSGAGSGGGCSGSSSSSKKWTCAACTYENWPRATRCAICYHPKNYKPYLDPAGTQDIYEIASLVGSESNLYNPRNKWSCPSCTYLNWPKAIKCVQCQRRRSTSPTSSSSLDSHHTNLNHSHHNRNRNENQTYPLYPSWTPGSPSPPPQPPTTREDNMTISGYFNHQQRQQDGGHPDKKPPPPRTLNPDQQAQMFMNFNLRRSMKTKSPPPQASSGSNSVVSDSLIQKWSCSMCTYENWPKSVKCSMCYTHRPTSLFTSSSTSSVGEQPKNSGHRLTESIERLSLTPRGQAEASGGIVIEEEVRGHQVLNDDHRSGFSSDSDEGEGQEGTQRLSSSSHRLRWGGRIIRRQMKDSFNSPSSSSPQIESITITIYYVHRQKSEDRRKKLKS